MGKIVISENISLDGVIQDPTGEDGTGRGNWFGQVTDHDRAEWAQVEFDEALGADAMLLGRRTYTWFLARGWAARPGEWADRLRSLPKYVVTSSALADPGWGNSTAVTGEPIAAIAAVKQQVAGDIVVYGSARLAHTLLAHDLVDELRLMTYPVVVGAGERLFGESDGARGVRRVGTRPVGDGLALLTYQFDPAPIGDRS